MKDLCVKEGEEDEKDIKMIGDIKIEGSCEGTKRAAEDREMLRNAMWRPASRQYNNDASQGDAIPAASVLLPHTVYIVVYRVAPIAVPETEAYTS